MHQKVERELYTGEVVDINKLVLNADSKTSPKNHANNNNNHHDIPAAGFHNRPATRAG